MSPDGTECTIHGSVTSTVVGRPGVSPLRCIGVTSCEGSVDVPSGATSRRLRNRVASVEVFGVIVRRTREGPASSSDDCSAEVANPAVWAGTTLSAAVAWSSAPNVLRIPDSPGTAVIAAGVPPAGAPTCCAGPRTVTVRVWARVPSMPG